MFNTRFASDLMKAAQHLILQFGKGCTGTGFTSILKMLAYVWTRFAYIFQMHVQHSNTRQLSALSHKTIRVEGPESSSKVLAYVKFHTSC